MQIISLQLTQKVLASRRRGRRFARSRTAKHRNIGIETGAKTCIIIGDKCDVLRYVTAERRYVVLHVNVVFHVKNVRVSGEEKKPWEKRRKRKRTAKGSCPA